MGLPIKQPTTSQVHIMGNFPDTMPQFDPKLLQSMPQLKAWQEQMTKWWFDFRTVLLRGLQAGNVDHDLMLVLGNSYAGPTGPAATLAAEVDSLWSVDGITNGMTPVIVVPAPPNDRCHKVSKMTFANVMVGEDLDLHIYKDDAGVVRTIWKGVLYRGETLQSDGDNWVLDSVTKTIKVVLGAVPSQEVNWTATYAETNLHL
jgi:hypothetical protein